MTECVAYANHLYANDLEGYLQLASITGKDRNFRGSYITGQALNSLDGLAGEVDRFITPNSYYRPQRLSQNIRHFRSLFIDLDLDGYGKAEAVYNVVLLAEKGAIPEPTMVVDSGRGIHLYWRVEHAPASAAWTWQELQDYLYKQLRHLGADPKATDSARLLRLPGTINSRNGALSRILAVSDKKYSMRELRDKYLSWEHKTTKAKKKQTSSGTVSYIFNPYTLHRARLDDLLTICKLRNFHVTGYRNSILHLYAYWQGITMRDDQELKDAVVALNNRFTEPLKPTEVRAIIRCIPKVVKSFLEPSDGLETGYNYSNNRLIEMLEIDEREQRHLKTIIGKDEKYRRNNARRTPRNEAGLTPREQQAKETKTKILELRERGLTVKQIADEIGLTIEGVKYHLYRT